YSGSQRFSTGRFTGDQQRSWDPVAGLRSALTAMLSGGLSGWPYWGPDIAGVSDAADPATERELWTRWVELGALSPPVPDLVGAPGCPGAPPQRRRAAGRVPGLPPPPHGPRA